MSVESLGMGGPKRAPHAPPLRIGPGSQNGPKFIQGKVRAPGIAPVALRCSGLRKSMKENLFE